MKRMMVGFLVTMGIASCRLDAGDGRSSGVLCPGEELRYKVKWAFVRLGSIVIRTRHDSISMGPDEVEVAFIIESNPALGILDFKDSTASLVRRDSLWSNSFYGWYRNGEDCRVQRHLYNSQTRTAAYSVRDVRTGALLTIDTLHNVPPYVEGPSLFMMTRYYARLLHFSTVPTLIGGKLCATDLEFENEIGETEIGAIDFPVRTRRYSGFAHWTGGSSAGVNGSFTGWVTDDDASIPVRAEMKVLVGSIVLELEQWTRPGWSPPRPVLLTNNDDEVKP